jgi:hypothetical protein
MTKKKEEEKKESTIKSLGKCQSFKDLEKFIKNQPNDRITAVLDKALLKPTNYDDLVKLMKKENTRIGSNDFTTKSRIKSHIKHRESVQNWVFQKEKDNIQLIGLE